MAKSQQESHKRERAATNEQEAVLNLFKTSDRLQHRFARLFREYGLTASQYNILRILRTEGKSMPCLEIAQRTITVVPGITGLIDRLELANPSLVKRQRDTEDRRVVNISITQAGLDVLARIDEPMAELHRELLTHFSAEEIAELGRLLDKARQQCEGESDE